MDKNKILIIVVVVLIGAWLICTTIVNTSTENSSIPNWNVTAGLNKVSENDNCTFYEAGDYKFRVCTGDDKYKEGFEKDDNGMYKKFDVDTTKYSGGVGGSGNMLYGEYVKYNDKIYWVEAQHTVVSTGEVHDVASNLSNHDLEKIRGFLTYFNEHNNVSVVI